MGAWGPAIFSNDTASDVKEQFKEFVADGYSPEEATKKIIAHHNPQKGDLEDYCPFWLGLAATQYQTGRLLEQVKLKALDIILSGDDLAIWEGSSDYKKRTKALEKLASQLEGPQKQPTKIKKRYRERCEWKLGDIIAYQLRSGKNSIFRVVDFDNDNGRVSPIVEVYDWSGEEYPSELELRRLQIKKVITAMKNPSTRIEIIKTSERAYPTGRITETGINIKPEVEWSSPFISYWQDIDELLEDFFELS